MPVVYKYSLCQCYTLGLRTFATQTISMPLLHTGYMPSKTQMISVPLLHICPLRLCAPLMSLPLLTIWHVSMPLLHKVHDMCASGRTVMF